ncbi:hypothetical protein [Corynebacterium sp. p3-SID1056]|uniref:hypothetical protein n=1 Tax=Corynebacterium sp. p3-SID1056 TaxID=2916092 RepID=UPI0021A8AF74|nr:hypothetical protein [Corynebacterium sp. p3-SID1056]MCT2338227.1 hypothetical protein [Corynebacterium sp. p3-SID1056]
MNTWDGEFKEIVSLFMQLVEGDVTKSELESDLARLAQGIVNKTAQYDPARTIQSMRIRSSAALIIGMTSQDEYLKADYGYAPALIEMAAILIYCNKQLCAPETYKDLMSSEGWGLLEELFESLRRIRSISTLIRLPFEARLDKVGWLNAIHSASRQWIRETTYRETQFDLYEELFGAPIVQELIEETRGYTYHQLYSVLAWILEEPAKRSFDARDELGAVISRGYQPSVRDLERGNQAWTKMFHPTFLDATFSAEEIANETKVPVQLVGKVLEDFSFDFKTWPMSKALEALKGGTNPLFEFPLIQERAGRYLLPNGSLVAPSVKKNLESFLLSNSAYGAHRGQLVEKRLVDVLRIFLPDAQIFFGLKYSHPETGRGEADALLVIGGVAIIFEVKAATLFKAGEPTNVSRFRRQMWNNIRKASNQVEKLRTLIATKGYVPVERGDALDLSSVVEVHTVIVTLDDLLELATRPLDLIDTSILDQEGQLPWLISIGDLQVILELIDEPSELLVYLRRRRDPKIAKKYLTTDELDMFLTFRQNGLWAEDDEDANILVSVAPATAVVDVWKNGLSHRKPHIKETSLLRYAREARKFDMPHWFEFGAALLSLSEDSQDGAQVLIGRLLEKTKDDHLPHKAGFLVEDGEHPRFGSLLVFQTAEGFDRLSVRNSLPDYLHAQRIDMCVSRAFGCVIDGQGRISDLFYDAGISSQE